MGDGTYANLGMDLLLDEDGDLQVGTDGDLKETANGRECLLQDCKHVLDTLPGDLYDHATYGAGIPRLVGEESDPNFVALTERAIRDALTYDEGVGPRIQETTLNVTGSMDDSRMGSSFAIEFAPMDEDYTNTFNWVYALGWEPDEEEA